MGSAQAESTFAIDIRQVGVRVGSRWLLRGLDVQIKLGETFVLMGASGCGKTTTLRTINRLVEPNEGSVFVRGMDVTKIDPAQLRRGMGYVIQDAGLFSHYTVRRNVGIMLELMRWPAQRIRNRVEQLLHMVGLPPEQFADRYPSQLSGGERQRVGIARALAADPPIVLLDEPFSSLDPVVRERLQTEFLNLSRGLHKTFVLVTHDIFEAVRLADRIGVMADGTLAQCGSPSEIVRQPANNTVAALTGPQRYQLRLMTTYVREALEHVADRTEIGSARTVSVDLDASLWEALDCLEKTRADVVTAPDGPFARPRYLSRTDLFRAIERSCS